MQQKTVTTDILDIAYREYGAPDGWPCIMGHGFPYDAQRLCRDRADHRAGRRAGAGALAARLRADAVPFRSDVALRRAGGARRRSCWPSWMRSGIARAVVGGYDWGGRAACVVSVLYPERVDRARLRQFLQHPEHRPRHGAGLRRPEEAALWYQYLFPQRARPPRAGARTGAALRASSVAHVVAEMGLRRRDVRDAAQSRSTTLTSSMS